MNVFVVIRDTISTSDSKVVFDKRNLNEDHSALQEVVKELWPEDPHFEIFRHENSIRYRAEVLPCLERPIPVVEICKSEYDSDVWLWGTHWSVYDYNDNLLQSLYELGHHTEYMKAAEEALESYKRMVADCG